MHRHWQALVRAGEPLISTVGEPGAHGALRTGRHGWGVSTPRAAEVAAATCGFDGVMHIPNGATLAMALKSWIVAAGCPPAVTGGPVGMAVSTAGVVPKLHITWAVPTTCWAIRPRYARAGAPTRSVRATNGAPAHERYSQSACSSARRGPTPRT